METLSIICPKCNHAFALEDVAKHVVDELASERIEHLLEAAKATQLEELRKELHAEDAKSRQKLERELAEFKSAAQKNSNERDALDSEISTLKAQVKVSKEQEIQLRQERAKLEEEKNDLKLEVQRAIDKERQQIFDEALTKAKKVVAERYEQKLSEAEKRESDAKQDVERLQRRLEQGSQQLQGEVAELSLEDTLRDRFVDDVIVEIKKGVRGADAVQAVNGRNGPTYGTILWESKNTQAWSDDWCDKLLEDQRNRKADVSVIVSRILPSNVRNFGHYKGVWVCSRDAYVGLAEAIRIAMRDLFSTKRMLEGQTDKASLLYKYVLSSDFRNKINGVMSTFGILQEDLIKERTAIERLWSKREKSLGNMQKLVAAMYGDIQGYAGNELEEPEALALPAPEIDAETDTSDEELPF